MSTLPNFQKFGAFGVLALSGLPVMQPQASERETPSLEEVVVTANHRATVLQETPSAISVLAGRDLIRSGTLSVASLVGQVPGLSVVDAGPSNLRIGMRGAQGFGEAMAGLYFDEIPVTGSVGATNDAGGSTPSLGLFDVERVEVLRGPQGTLYGSNAMTGAVKIHFARPTSVNEGEGQVDLLTRENGRFAHRLQGMINVPLIADRLASRIVVYREDGGGYVDSDFRQDRNVNDVDRVGGRALIRWMPTGNLSIDAAAYLQDDRGDQPIWVLGAARFQDVIPSRRVNKDMQRIYALTANWEPKGTRITAIASRSERTFDQVSADPSGFFATLLGNPAVCARLRGGGAPCGETIQNEFDSYVQSFIPNVIVPHQETDATNLELRIGSSESSRLGWTGGLFYSRRLSELDNLQRDVDPVSGLITDAPPRFERQVHDVLEQSAGFLNVSWTATPAATLEMGTRRFHYSRQVSGQTITGLDLIGSPITPDSTNHSAESGWVSRFSASYRLTPGLMGYVQVARGYRPGGANQVIGLPDSLVAYRSDSLWSYEAGFKAQAWGGRLDFNASAYHADWHDLQVTGSRPDGLFRFISNAGSATLSGVELELQSRVSKGLTLRGNATALRAKLSEDQINGSVVAAGKKGDRIPYTPRITAGLSAEYKHSLSQNLTGLLLLNGRYVGESYSEFRPTNALRQRLPSYSLVRLQVGIEEWGSRWSIFLYVDNVLDDTAIVAASANSVTLGKAEVVSAPPRTIGASVRVRF